MPSSNQTMAAKNKKQPKPRRSLKKHAAMQSVDDKNALAIDMSKAELDSIFFGLHSGGLENPQAALAKVYLLALDSIENALLQGIADLCTELTTGDALFGASSPLAPWLGHILPNNPENIQQFRENLKNKFDQAKQNLQNTVSRVLSQDADGRNIIGTGSDKSREALIELLKDPAARVQIPFAQKQLTDNRLSEIYRDIQSPVPEDGVKRYHFSKTPGTYHFSFGSNDVPKAAPQKTAPVMDNAAQTVSDPAGDISAFESHGTPSSDVSSVAGDVTEAMTQLAIQIGNDAIKAFAEDHIIPKLSESLKNDPRFSQNDELCAFVDTLEDESLDNSDATVDSVDNDELAKAFAILLDEFE